MIFLPRRQLLPYGANDTLCGREAKARSWFLKRSAAARRGSGHRQSPPAPELQIEEAAAPAMANLQLSQGAVRDAADEVEVADQRQRRGRRRKLAFAASTA